MTKVLILQGGNNEEHKVSINTAKQIAKALKQIVIRNSSGSEFKNDDRIKRASGQLFSPLEETQFLIDEIIQSKKRAINLLPRSREVRKLQHQLISHYQLKSISVGVEPHRYVRLFPSGIR